MVKNTTGGKKAKGAKNPGEVGASKDLPMAEDGQTYALVTKMLGDRRITVKLSDGQEIMAIIPGRFRSKDCWVTPGCHVLLNVREYQTDKADVAYVYSASQSKRLQKIGEISGDVKKDDIFEDTDDINIDEL